MADRKDDDVRIERDHPQTRKGESDARGSADWRDDVVKPEGEGGSPTVGELAEEAEDTRREGVGEKAATRAFGSGRASDE